MKKQKLVELRVRKVGVIHYSIRPTEHPIGHEDIDKDGQVRCFARVNSIDILDTRYEEKATKLYPEDLKALLEKVEEVESAVHRSDVNNF